ncbi:4-hydroxybenzoate polyprenyl transferase [Polytolypa hystricis UAMH7299]|uniref:4-hydroxybenzoate polyprenyltransferase, mitochondrial n=1 Tax=Polytolypa hystricis (strain UAMH7299) TaxID=1447883 RepID=A0A2B7XH23_POLH7|nr:4-hydroxybenzoate polyprenyl transferase [Polytolypa hystricis UAMH7299]
MKTFLAHGGLRLAALRTTNSAATTQIRRVGSCKHYLGQQSQHHYQAARSSQTQSPVARSHRNLAPLVPRAFPRYISSSPSPSQSTVVSPTDLTYTPPSKGVIASLPKSWIPYAELIRLDKPTGTYYLYFPCLFSTLMAAPFALPIASPLEVASISGLFFVGALVMRGAGCTINDLWDRNLDPHVARTKLRPIARKAITPQKAIIFTGGQLLVGLGVLLQFPYQCLFYGIPSLLFVAAYPLAKRVTNYPQAVLGLTFSWGAMMGFPALGVDLLSNPDAMMTAAALYSSCVAWTVLYDMIYAHMDIKYDAAAGIKSIALKHEKHTKAILSGLAAVQVGLLGAAGVAAGLGPIYFVGTCGSAIVTLGTMIWRVQLKSVENCWWWFRNGCWITGGGITLGLVGEYLANFFGWYDSAAPITSAAHAEGSVVS